MEGRQFFVVNLLLIIQAILFLAGFGTCSRTPFPSKEGNRNISCFPCFQKYLVKLFSEEHDILNLDFYELFHEGFCYLESCKGLVHYPDSMLTLSAMQRHLIGEGSHRRLVSSMTFNVHSDFISKLSLLLCEVVAVERLPSGAFADPFELQHLVQRSAFADASVFGDTNLELPSALSNQSVVEVHVNASHKLETKELMMSIDLPLHARYPPLDASGSGYSRVEMGLPHFFLHCKREESEQEDCLWTSITWNTTWNTVVAGNEDTIWYIPCGNPGHAGIVTIVTFLSAIISALSIIFTTIYYSSHKIQVHH